MREKGGNARVRPILSPGAVAFGPRAAAALLGLALLAAGCSHMDSTIVGSFPGPLALQDWRTIARTNEPARGEVARMVNAGGSEAFSNYFVIIRSRELPHRHLRHDATVVILEGHGTMTIGKEEKRVGPGAVIFIPRGTVHHFRNDGDRPTVALVVYAPPYDRGDREIVQPGAEGREEAMPGEPRRPTPEDLKKGGGPEPPGRPEPGAEPGVFDRPAGDEKDLPARPLSSPGAVPAEEASPSY